MALPEHIAIVMDGNGRWAEARGEARTFGHRAGIEPVLVPAREVAKAEGAVTCCSLVFEAGDQGAQ